MKTIYLIPVLILVIAIIFVICPPAAWAQEKSIKSESLKQTTITPNIEEKISEGKNLVFCSTFQLAWNELTDKILKGDLHMVNETPLVEILNRARKTITRNDLSDKYYIAMAGYGKEKIVDRINSEMKKKFKAEAWYVKEKLNPDDILAFAFLLKNLKFKTQFDDSPFGMRFGEGKESVMVKSFGIAKFMPKDEKMKELAKQVDILFYNANEKEFAVRLITDSPDDELVLARVAPESDLMKTFQKVQASCKIAMPSKLSDGDILQIPEINFFIEHFYDELIGKNLKNKGFSQYMIAKALQLTKFKLDKTGAYLKSKAEIKLVKGAPGTPVKVMTFNRPFLLYMKEKKARNPYFMMWVDNAELLVKK